MNRLLTLLLALTGSFTLLSATAMSAPAGYYSATPATAPADGKVIVRDMLWKCDRAICAAPQSTSRAAIICAAAARQLGAFSTFRAGSEEFDAAALAKCNAKASGKLEVARAN